MKSEWMINHCTTLQEPWVMAVFLTLETACQIQRILFIMKTRSRMRTGNLYFVLFILCDVNWVNFV